MKKIMMMVLTAVLGLVATSAALGAEAPAKAVAYINPDTGAATENGDVNEDSECETPDQRDKQELSASGSSANNVHVDACLFHADGEAFDGAVTFESKGRGVISACPDPDQMIAQVPQIMNGDRVAYLHDHDDNGQSDHCHQTGYQAKGAAGDDEYHVRLNNDSTAGPQKITFCFDPQQDASVEAGAQPKGHGCSDSAPKSKVLIRWVK